MLIDNYLPDFHYHEVHSITIQATPERVFNAILELRPSEMSLLVSWMLKLRDLPGRLFGRQHTVLDERPLLTQLFAEDFILLEKQENTEIVFGTIGQFWKISPSAVRVPDPAAFIAFHDTDFVKTAANMRLSAQPVGILLTTETRIWAPDEETRKKFARYWLLIATGSAVIRRLWLRGIRRKAESSGGNRA